MSHSVVCEQAQQDTDGSDSQVSDVRSSWQIYFQRDETPLCTHLDARINTPPPGESTVFPNKPMEVRAVAGHGVLFAYDTPDAWSRTLHGGAPVVDGEKWFAMKWLRQGSFA